VRDGLRVKSRHSSMIQRLRRKKILTTIPGTLAVTKNLEVALRYLRLVNESRIFWIGAICINQEDFQERSAEVGRMGRDLQQCSSSCGMARRRGPQQ
jgi:hypothetical protein